jgi:hypothetical protein
MKKGDKTAAELKALSEKFAGVDPDQVAAMQEQIQKVEADEEKALLAKGEFDEVFKRRTAAMIANHETQVSGFNNTISELTGFNNTISELTGAKDKLTTKLGKLLIDREVQIAIGKQGMKIRQGALPDILARARNVWKLTEDADMQPLGPNGEALRSPADANNFLNMEEYASGLLEEAPHLFEGAKGSDSQGNERRAAGANNVDMDDPVAMGDNVEALAGK